MSPVRLRPVDSLALAAEIFTALLTVSGIVYSVMALWAARRFERTPTPQPDPTFTPGITVLKPIKGVDPRMHAGLASHCAQNYAGEFELLFGVSSLSDPAVAEVARLRVDFPHINIRLIECPERLGPNGKLSNLTQMLPHARFEHILVNDSDILVSPNYLTHIAAAFNQTNSATKPIGLVTAPYIGIAGNTVWSRLEALGISTDFIPGVLTARRIEGGIHFGLGSTLAVSREALDRIGGLAPLVDYLADDYELGARIAAAGYAIELSSEVVETGVPPYDIAGFFQHQLRWSRSTRDSRRWGYAGLVFTFGLPWAFLNLIASGLSLESIALFVLALLVRVALALTVGVGILGDVQVLRDLLLLLPRDLIALFLWVWSFAGDTVAWRGERFLLKRGKLTRISLSS